METTLPENHKNVAALVHLSTFAKFIFPLGNFLAPLLLWTTNKEKPFVHEHGREAINFQLSILVYTLLIGILCLPFFAIFASDFVSLIDAVDDHMHDFTIHNIQNLTGYFTLFFIVAILLFGLFVFELYAVINATIHANKGQHYKYPLCIPFIRIQDDLTHRHQQEEEQPSSSNQSENEHVS